MMDITVGQIVISKAGRDKAQLFVVIKLQGEYAYLVDGRYRVLANPKRKNVKHIQPTKTIDKALQKAINENLYLKDADFRSALKVFLEKREVISHG